MNRDDEIFSDALELPPGERAAFLDRACAGDSALRARVDALLTSYDTAANFLERSPVERPAARAEEQIGDVIGRYTLLKRIGDGGGGVVYLAEQKEPVRRLVALKVIKLGMDTRSVIARFEAERQALAMMDHPDIARVFDAGATEAGRPFFVMEYVDGVPITKFCDDHSLTMSARLELFARVCLALQHAHQKGVIHRDVKPSNILVALHDGVASPKVIDFGIAKATQGRLTEQTVFTALEQFIGTPAYMSPEQAELRDLDIDTRSDVYSLGVLLYELLTGRPPYDAKSLIRAGVEEIRRIIREVEPPRPSTRVLTLTDADRSTVARSRCAAPTQLTSVLRGDLDWIVMRCLEKDRARRYSTAHELADDVRRHLRQEPILARPPDRLYRVQRFVARNRVACASAAAVVAALVIGTVVSVREAVRANRAEVMARAERDAATLAGRAEALARADAQRRQEQTEELLTFMLGDFRSELKKIGRLNLLDAIGEKALANFAALDPRDLTDSALTRQAKALTQIGEIRMDQARYADAASAFATAYARAAALVDRHPRDGNMLFERGQAEYWLGFVALRRGDFGGERQWFTRYRDSTLALATLEGNTPRAQLEVTYGHHNLAALELESGNIAGAQEGFLAEQRAVASLLAATPDDTQLRFRLADIASWLGTAAERDGRFADALDRYGEMAMREKELVAKEPAVARWRLELAQSATFTGNLQAMMGRTSDALASYAEAHRLLEALVVQDSKNRQWLSALMWIQLQQLSLLIATGDVPTATTLASETRAKIETLVEAEPASHVFTRNLAVACRQQGRLDWTAQLPSARANVDRALELGDRLIKEARADNLTRWEFAQACLLAGRIEQVEGRREAAQLQWDRVLEVVTPHLANSNDWRFLDPAAQALLLSGRKEEARPFIERLRRFGYHPVDPAAATLLDLSYPSATSTPNK